MGRFSPYWFVLSLALLTAVATIHVATYFDLDFLDRWPILWGVYLAIFAIDALAIFDAKDRTGARGKTPMFTAFEPRAQRTADFIAAILMAYALLMLVSAWRFEGAPNRIDGKPVISNHGIIVRQLTEREFLHAKAVDMRFFSALMLAFCGGAALELLSLALLERKKRAKTRVANSTLSN